MLTLTKEEALTRIGRKLREIREKPSVGHANGRSRTELARANSLVEASLFHQAEAGLVNDSDLLERVICVYRPDERERSELGTLMRIAFPPVAPSPVWRDRKPSHRPTA